MPKWVYVHIHDDEMTQKKKINKRKQNDMCGDDMKALLLNIHVML